MGVGIIGDQYRWPNRTIPYAVDPALPEQDRVVAAVAHWNDNSIIRFVPRNGETDYLLITRRPGCAVSDVGRRGGEQCVSLGDGCSTGSIIHELGHTVGLWHEHCHPERDDWVTIDFTNIEDGCEDNFAINSIAGVPTPTEDLGGYDYGSIMHYPQIAFPIDPTVPVITPKRPLPPGVVMGQRDELSAGDLAAVEQMYRGVPAAG
jgi:hypothetical protein